MINDDANTIVNGEYEINTNVMVEDFLGYLVKDAPSEWKVVASGTATGNAAEFEAATTKGSQENLVPGDKLAVMAVDGTIKNYYIIVGD